MAKGKPMTEMTDTIRVRVLVFKDDGLWVAQCLEYDIGAQAANLDTLHDRMMVVFKAELKESVERHGKPFAGIDKAPERFHKMWGHRARSVEVSPSAWVINAMNVNLGLVA